MIKKLQFVICVWVMLLASAVSFASGDIQERDGKCFLWEIDSKTATVYLMGSFHMFKPEMYPLNYCFTDAFKKADTMVVEVNLNKVDENQMAKLFADKGIYQGDVTIEQRLSKETMEKLEDYLDARNIDIIQVNKMKPWFLGLTIAIQEMAALGYDPNLGVDMYFLAKAGDKNIIGLETIEEQMEILAGDPDDIQDLALRSALDDIPDMESLLNRMVEAWTQGDADTLDSIIREPEDRYPLLKEQIKRTIDDRNIEMAKKIAEFLKTDNTYFIVVGGGHIGGAKGLLALLKEIGYAARQIPKLEDSPGSRQKTSLTKPLDYIALSRCFA